MKGGLLCQKKEMTKVRKDGKQHAVTLLTVVPQQIVRYKSIEKDWYSAAVVGIHPVSKEGKTEYQQMIEFSIDDEFVQAYAVWSAVSTDLIDGKELVAVSGVSKGKWFQGAMKRFNLKWGQKTHGSKFHRQVWSMGNRKPRRVQKGHPHAGRMWWAQITIKDRPVLGVYKLENEVVVWVKGAVPGSYNGMVSLLID